MQFIDEAKIFIKSGHGGPGCVSFRRAANLPKGGPNGGDGGRGGHVIIRVVPGLNTLIDYRYSQHFKASNGEHGMGSDCHGAKGKDCILRVPVGTQIFAEDDETLLFDFTTEGEEIIIAKGGQGGLGNLHFKSSTNQAPRQHTEGEEGEEMWIWLKLKLLSDIGLVGLPNAGKSTFLSVVSRAKPKIADYPFTTLKPQLGVAAIDGEEYVIADLPGLIEGAHEGIGLGIRFLKHAERCRVILHLIDGTQENIAEAYQTIRNELESYSENLANKPEIIAISKLDAISQEDIADKIAELSEHTNAPIFTLSSISGTNLTEILRVLRNAVKTENQEKEHIKPQKPYSPV